MSRKGKRSLVPCKGGHEQDAFSKWRQLFRWSPGTIKWIKRHYHRRVRSSWRNGVRNDEDSF